MSESPCPLCGQSLGECKAISVCSPCHSSLTGSVSTTAEFAVPDLAAAFAAGGLDQPSTVSVDGCSWCGKSSQTVRHLLSARNARICNECVSLCATILESELGPDWTK